MNRHLSQNGNGEKNMKIATAINAMAMLVTGKTSGVLTIDLPI